MISKLWPARAQAKNAGPVTDLDAIVAEPVDFKFGGKVYTIKPFTLAQFLKFTNANSSLQDLVKDETKVTEEILAQRYKDVLDAVCEPKLSLEAISKMEQVQIAALYQLVVDCVTGQVDFGEDSKKKRIRLPIYESGRR